MGNTKENFNQRLLMLESLLIWEGRLNNARIRELFSLSPVRASQWIRDLREARPGWTEWNNKTRSFHISPHLYAKGRLAATRTLTDKESFSRYLALINVPSVGEHADGTVGIVWDAFPDISIPKPHVFSALSDAIHMKQAVSITHASMSNPAPTDRLISPHSLVRAGRRWHVRAYCHRAKEFRDFSLGRITKVIPANAMTPATADDDVAWNTPVQLRLVAHPNLSREQEELIRAEYFQGTASRVDTCRAALVGYYIQDLRVATDPEKQLPPEFNLCVCNIKEIRKWLFHKE